MEKITEAIQAEDNSVTPLCVDLDGTLIRSDLFIEGIFGLIKSHPLEIPRFVMHLLSGRAEAKQFVAERVPVNPELLPYNPDVLALIERERRKGRKIVLATASHKSLADSVANHLGIFDEVLGTEGSHNLKSDKKALKLEEEYGRFDYVGDSSADLTVWKRAENAYVVSSDRRFISAAEQMAPVAETFAPPSPALAAIKALRPHQWVKNLLLFLPPIMAHRLFDSAIFFNTLISFVVFCATASTVYLLNDFCDLNSDRRHPKKKNRPLANGTLLPYLGVQLILAMLALAALGAMMLPHNFTSVLLTYFILTCAYSFHLKQVVVLDIVLLAGLYTVRIIAGGAAAGIPVSKWLLGFSMFMFFSLACVKRFSELLAVRERKQEALHGRGYQAADIEQLSTFGAASGYLSVLVLALYVSSPDVSALYTHPSVLWLLCPVVLYWISRTWLLAHRGEVNEDPIVFALSDKVSYLVGLISLLIVVIGK